MYTMGCYKEINKLFNNKTMMNTILVCSHLKTLKINGWWSSFFFSEVLSSWMDTGLRGIIGLAEIFQFPAHLDRISREGSFKVTTIRVLPPQEGGSRKVVSLTRQ